MSADDDSRNDSDAAQREPGRQSDEVNRAPAPGEEVYELLWTHYRDGHRSRDELARVCGVRTRTVSTAISHGWPEKGWASLRDRLVWFERQKTSVKAGEIAAADRDAATRLGQSQAGAWREFLPKGYAATLECMVTLGALGVKLRRAMEAASFVRYRTIKKLDANNRLVSVNEAYVSGAEVAKACAIWAQAIRENAQTMALLTGGARVHAPEGDVPDLTEEQIAELEQGNLPAGVTPEQVARAVLAIGSAGKGA